MRVFARGAITLAVLVIAGPASAADRTLSITAAAPSAEWTSSDSSGLNPTNSAGLPNPAVKEVCTKDPNSYCDSALVRLQLSEVGGGNLRFRIEGFKPTSDYDLKVFEADENGVPQGGKKTAKGDRATPQPAPYPTEVPAPPVWPEQIPADPPSSLPWEDPMTVLTTSNGDFETVDLDIGGYVDETGSVDAYFLVEIPYWMVAHDHYTAKVTLTDTVPFDPNAGEEE